TLEGLASYRSSMNTVESKLNELQHAQELQLAVTQLAAPIKPGPLSYERKQLDDKIELAGNAFRAYQKALADTIQRGRDPDGGFNENQNVDKLRESFEKLEQVLEAETTGSTINFEVPMSLTANPVLTKAIQELLQASGDLQKMIFSDQRQYIQRDKSHLRGSFWIVGS